MAIQSASMKGKPASKRRAAPPPPPEPKGRNVVASLVMLPLKLVEPLRRIDVPLTFSVSYWPWRCSSRRFSSALA
ncbi:MAG: hypothetical protein R2845_02955 [Thermomicrobiales bacterium]